MPDHLIIDGNRQPAQIRCLHCGFAQDLPLPMAIKELAALERRLTAKHRGCKPRRAGDVRLDEGPVQRGIIPKPQFPPPRIIREDFLP